MPNPTIKFTQNQGRSCKKLISAPKGAVFLKNSHPI